MRHRFTKLTAGALLIFAGAASPVLAAQPTDDCAAPNPSIETPGATVTEEPAPGRADLTLSRRLATCGSVLDPPAVGDPDIVEPAPRIGDPMNINPTPPEAIRP
jgi:hypothetical protein